MTSSMEDFSLSPADLERRSYVLEVLHHIGLSLSASLGTERLIAEIVNATGTLLGELDGIVLALHEPSRDVLTIQHTSRSAASLLGKEIAPGVGVIGQAFSSGARVTLPLDVATPDISDIFLPISVAGPRTVVGLPLRGRDRIYGVIGLQRIGHKAFAADELWIAELLAAQASLALADSRLIESEHQARQQSEVLLDMAIVLGTRRSLQDVIDSILELCARVVPFTTASLYIYGSDEKLSVALKGFPPEMADRILADRFQSKLKNLKLRDRLWERKQPVIIPDVSMDPMWDTTRYDSQHIRSWMGVPLIASNRLVGMLSLDGDRVNMFSAEQARIAQAFANHAALAVENAYLYDADREAQRQKDTLLEASRSLALSLDLNALLEMLLERCRELVPYQAAAIYAYSDAQHPLAIAARGFEGTRAVRLRQAEAEGELMHRHIHEEMVTSGQSLYIADCWNDEKWEKREDNSHIRCSLGMPLIAQGEVIGSFWLESDQVDAFSPRDINLVELFAGHAAAAVRNARLYDSERRSQQLHASLLTAVRAISGTLDLDTLLNRILEECAQLITYEAGALYAYKDSGYPLVRALRGFASERRAIVEELHKAGDLGQSRLQEKLIEGKKPLNITDCWTDDLWNRREDNAHVRSIMAVPLIWNEAVIGALSLDSSRVAAFSAADVEAASILASHAAVAIENAHLYQLEQQARLRTAAILQAATIFSSTQSLPELLNKILKLMCQAIPSDSGAVMVLGQRGRQNPIVELYGLDHLGSEARASLVHFLGHQAARSPIWHEIVRTNRPLLIDNVKADPRWQKHDEADFVASWMAVPIIAQGRAIGMFTLDSKQPAMFNPEHLAIAEALVAQAAVVIENARLITETQEALIQTEMLALASRALIDAQSPQQWLEIASFPALDHHTGSAILLALDPDTDRARASVRVVAGLTPERLPLPSIGTSFALEKAPMLGSLLDSLEPVVMLPDLSATPEEADLITAMLGSAIPIRAGLAIPLANREGIRLGLLMICWEQSQEISIEVQHFYRVIGPQLASVFEAQRLYVESQAMRERFEDVVIRTSEGVWEIDTRFRVTFCSEKLLISLGYNLPDVIGRSVRWLLPRDSRRHLTQIIATVRADLQTQEIVHPLRAANGCAIWHSSSIIPVLDKEGRLIAYRGVTRNITEQLEAEQRESLAFEIGQRLTGTLSIDEILQMLIDQITETLGYSYVHIRLYDPSTDRLATYAESSPTGFHGEGILLQSRPGLIPLAARLREPVVVNDVLLEPEYAPTVFGGKIRSEAVLPLYRANRLLGVLDIQSEEANRFNEKEVRLLQNLASQASIAIENARLYEALEHQAEQLEDTVIERTVEIVKERERLNAIVANTEEGILFTSADGSIEYANPASGIIVGRPIRDLVGTSLADFLETEIVKPRETLDEMRFSVIRGKVWRGELRIKRPDGSESDLDVTVTPVEGDNGAVANYVGVIRDITAEKEVNRMREQFVANVSHELRTPLANLKLYNTLLKAGLPEKRDTYLDVMARQITRLERLVENLLDLSRLDRDHSMIRRTQFDLNELIIEVMRAHSLAAEERGLEVELALADDLPALYADPDRIGQVLTNLLANAINYSRQGDQIGIRTGKTEEGQVFLCVWDTGIGIEPSELPFIFNRFFRSESAKVTGVPGTGLGLSIIKEIVDLHNGKIKVESEPGKGSDFKIYLPLVPPGGNKEQDLPGGDIRHDQQTFQG